jgi:hypothetical protein
MLDETPFPSIRQQVNTIVNNQLLLFNNWKLALSSLVEALDSTVSSLQGRPKELARALAARFITLVKQDNPQQGLLKPAAAPPPCRVGPSSGSVEHSLQRLRE